MFKEIFRRNKLKTSSNDVHVQKTKHVRFCDINSSNNRSKYTIGILIGIFLTLITFILYSIAFFTPHWKEISPNTHSLYVDNVDALIRTEILHYFNSIHRYTRHSYGLFHRCEYLLNSTNKMAPYQRKICTKNYLPLYSDEHFNECHSLPYYSFCVTTSEKKFNIENDYLRAKFDIPQIHHSSSSFSCDCHYPQYIIVSHALGIIALIFLILTAILFILFPLFKTTHQRLKIKCFAILTSFISIVFLMSNLINIYQHLEFESVEYLIAIRQHYKQAQIYKLSQDTKIAIDQFLASIQITIGYSAILGWIAFGFSIIDGILILLTCKIKHQDNENETLNKLISSSVDEQASPQFKPILSENSPLHEENIV